MAKKKTISQDNESLAEVTFEQAVRRLEEIVDDLEQNLTGLDQSLTRYEEGVRLIRHAHSLLSGAERKIELLRGVDEDGSPLTEPMQEEKFVSDTTMPGRSSGPKARVDSTDDMD